MAIESATDLAAFFHPDDFGVEMTAYVFGTPVVFNGVLTTGYVSESPGTTADISMLVPRIIAKRSDLKDLAQNDEIVLPDGKRVIVNDVQYKGELIVIHYHEVWA